MAQYNNLNIVSKKEIEIAKHQYKFALDYNQHNQLDLNQILIDYIDLKYEDIWTEKFCQKIKKEFKQQSIYYRLVKQGSILVYLCFHVFTIFLVLLMATLRQSFIAVGYVLIVLPRIKSGAKVLMQKNID